MMIGQTPADRIDAVVVMAPHQIQPAPGTDVDDVDIVDVWGQDSFPASDPPTNW